MRGGPWARAPRTMSWGHRTARPPTPLSGVESLPLPSPVNQPTLYIYKVRCSEPPIHTHHHRAGVPISEHTHMLESHIKIIISALYLSYQKMN